MNSKFVTFLMLIVLMAMTGMMYFMWRQPQKQKEVLETALSQQMQNLKTDLSSIRMDSQTAINTLETKVAENLESLKLNNQDINSLGYWMADTRKTVNESLKYLPGNVAKELEGKFSGLEEKLGVMGEKIAIEAADRTKASLMPEISQLREKVGSLDLAVAAIPEEVTALTADQWGINTTLLWTEGNPTPYPAAGTQYYMLPKEKAKAREIKLDRKVVGYTVRYSVSLKPQDVERRWVVVTDHENRPIADFHWWGAIEQMDFDKNLMKDICYVRTNDKIIGAMRVEDSRSPDYQKPPLTRIPLDKPVSIYKNYGLTEAAVAQFFNGETYRFDLELIYKTPLEAN